MGTSDTSAAASLEAKLRTFIEGLTDAEAGVFELMIDAVAQPEVAGFSQPGASPSGPNPSAVLSFSSVSNILKTRHDTAKNSISNVR